MNPIVITPYQTPQFRAAIKDEDGDWFDDLAAAVDDGFPISYSAYKLASALNSGLGVPVEHHVGVEAPATALLAPVDASEFNFSYVPDTREYPMFSTPGSYAVDFKIYPTTGSPIVWRVPVEVE